MADRAQMEWEVWRCQKHPSQRCSGVCPFCLRDRLCLLCPECVGVRPCACITSASCTTSSSSPISFYSPSEFFHSASGSAVGRVSHHIIAEPSLRRSRSVAYHFSRSGSVARAIGGGTIASAGRPGWRRGWWPFSKVKWRKENEAAKELPKLSRSKSVAESKGEGWFFPGSFMFFRSRKAAKAK